MTKKIFGLPVVPVICTKARKLMRSIQYRVNELDYSIPVVSNGLDILFGQMMEAKLRVGLNVVVQL